MPAEPTLEAVEIARLITENESLRAELRSFREPVVEIVPGAPEEAWWYSRNDDDERWDGGPFDSKSDAIEEGTDVYLSQLQPGESGSFCVHRGTQATTKILDALDVDNVIEGIGEWLYDNEGLDPDGDGPSLKEGRNQSAQAELSAWIARNVDVPSYWVGDGSPDRIEISRPATEPEPAPEPATELGPQ